MFRRMAVVVLAVCVVGSAAYYREPIIRFLGNAGDLTNPANGEVLKGAVDVGELLYKPVELPPLPESQPLKWRELVIEPCHVSSFDKQEVSSPRDGQLLCVGREVSDQEIEQLKDSRPVTTINVFDGQKNVVRKIVPLCEGDRIQYGQVVAIVNPGLALHEVESKKFKVGAAEADAKGTAAVLKEMQHQLEVLERMQGIGVRPAFTDKEIGDARVAVAKYAADSESKKKAIEIAQRELYQAEFVYRQHFLKSEVPGTCIVKRIFKTSGEGIKVQEPILQLWDIGRLRIQGSIDSQHFETLARHKDARVYLEPSVEIDPALELIRAHRAEVTSVAVCADGEHFVSGSADHTVCIWRRDRVEPVLTLMHGAGVRTVASSPKGPWILVGCDDGTITRWDLTQPSVPVKFREQHHGPVTALAFSPDGTFAASGGEDNVIWLWNAENPAALYPFDTDHGVDNPHQGTITSLSFTPQCKLVSAARDNTLRIWSLHTKGAKLLGEPIANRGGTVGQLGTSADGRYMLFDKGKTLQLLNTANCRTVCVLDNLGGASPFDTLALFSPNSSLMLTGGAGEGRLHLWKTSSAQERAYQVRELVTKDRTPITSAAFAPANHRFAVTGTKDGYVHMWRVPDEGAVKNHRIFADAQNQPLRLDLVEEAVESGKTRIAANVLNPQDRLRPGQRVTLVVVLPMGK